MAVTRAELLDQARALPRDELAELVADLADALALPEAERVAMACKLLEGVEGDDADAEQAWVTEIERRAREVVGGSVELLDHADVMAELAALERRE